MENGFRELKGSPDGGPQSINLVAMARISRETFCLAA